MQFNFNFILYSTELKTFQVNTNAGRHINLIAPGGITSKVSIVDPSQSDTSSNNILAYRPRFNDRHGSGLAGLFVNIEETFPCIKGLDEVFSPSCFIVTFDEDGFRKGRAFIDYGDQGNFENRVFSSSRDIPTYAIAVQDCPEFDSSCFPDWTKFQVTCELPRSVCP